MEKKLPSASTSEEPIHQKICTNRAYRTTVCNSRAPSDSEPKDRSLLSSCCGQSGSRTGETVRNFSEETFSLGASRLALDFSSPTFFFARSDFPSPHYLPLGLLGWLEAAQILRKGISLSFFKINNVLHNFVLHLVSVFLYLFKFLKD